MTSATMNRPGMPGRPVASPSAGLAGPAPTVDPADLPIPGAMLQMTRSLIWLYLILWIFEGSLRKWYLTSLSDVLLIIRDPVVVLIYLTAIPCRALKLNFFVGAMVVLGFVSFLAGTLVTGNMLVAGFGFRANFLHLPLVFVIGAVLTPDDIRKMGKFLLILAFPMAIIMAKQYQSDYDDWWNLGAGGGRMIVSVGGKVRASGTFSFISGPVAYFGLVTAFFLGFIALKGWTRWWFTVPALAGTILAAAVAGSRSLLLSLILVGAAFGFGTVFFPQALKKFAKWIVAGAIVFFAVSLLDVYQQGLATTSERFTMATDSEGGLFGSLYRLFEPMMISFEALSRLQPLGMGLGMGTNAGAALLGSRGLFLLAENEWPRVLLESGPFLGFAYLFLRLGLALWALRLGIKAARQGNLFPMGFWGAIALTFVSGQFGQPTTLGAAVLGMGFFLASLRMPTVLAAEAALENPGAEPAQPLGTATQQEPVPAPVRSFAVRSSQATKTNPATAGLPPRKEAKRWRTPTAPEPPPEAVPVVEPEQKTGPKPGSFSIRPKSSRNERR